MFLTIAVASGIISSIAAGECNEIGTEIVTKEFYGTEVTGDWINPCAGETLNQLATIREWFIPCGGGCLIKAIMYDEKGNPIKGGYKMVHGHPGVYPLVTLEGIHEFSVEGFPTLEQEIRFDSVLASLNKKG